MKRLVTLLLLCLTYTTVGAQWKWFNPMEAGFPVIQNQGFTKETGNTYTRLPERAKTLIRGNVWNLSRNSSGLAIHFYSNAPKIKIRYSVSGGLNMPHMPTTGVSGIDLYSIDSNGHSMFCFGNYSFGDTIQYSYENFGKDKYHDRGFEYRIYLPLYNSVKWLEIGIPDSNDMEFIPASPEKPVVVYGTSILQGGCASRPAMAWGTIVQRSLGYPLINLGFSGNGRLEKEVLDFVGELDARLYILDCLPNLIHASDEEVKSLVIAAVKQLRQTRTAPILLVDHAGNSNAGTDANQYTTYTRINKASREAYETLLSENIKDIHYLSCDELNFPPDAWVDYVHPSDLGMATQASAVEKKVREILRIPQGTISTTIPVTQRREPTNYEWQVRHRAILEHLQNYPPKSVILGNSITHFWGGEPAGPSRNGTESWEKVMRPAGFQNLGYGWDCIENVLWRVYHGELDGYQAKQVVLMIGTNNLGVNKNDEIVEGLRFLLSAIRDRQPNASIQVVGILPRRGAEKEVKNINRDIKQMALKNGYKFCDAGSLLLQKDGKVNESLFVGDGLHPNEKGYHLIAPEIVK